MAIKKFILLIVMLAILLALPWNVKAQTFDNRLDSVRVYVYNSVGVKSTGTDRLTYALTGYYINLAQSIVCDEFNVYIQIDTVIASSTSEWYQLPSDYDRIAEVSKMRGDTLRMPLTYISPDSIRSLGHEAKDFVHQPSNFMQPTHYTLKADKLMFYPKYGISPAIDSFIVMYYANPPALVSVSDTLVVSGAVDAVIFKATEIILNVIYEDYAKADRFRLQYESLKGN